MSYIFNTAPGKVSVVPDDAIYPFTLTMFGWGDFTLRTSLLTGFKFQTKSNAHIQQALTGYVYGYLVGYESIGTLDVYGVAFRTDCAGSSSGVFWSLNYYAVNGFSFCRNTVFVYVGISTFLGFLTEYAIEMKEPETRIAVFSFRFMTIPT